MLTERPNRSRDRLPPRLAERTHQTESSIFLALVLTGARQYIGPMNIFSVLIPASLLAVLGALGVGIYALFRGGEFGRSYSNRLMRLRVVLQALAVAVLVAAVWWRSRGG